MNSNYKIKETQDVENFFHGYAADFDSIYGHTKKRGAWDKFLDKYFRESMRGRFELSLKHASNPEIKTVLDIGCGGGVYCDAFLHQGKTVCGLDIAEGMLALAKQKTKQFVDNGKVSYVHAGYLEHHVDTKFDAGCLMGFFDYIKTPMDIFAKLNKEIAKEIYMSFPQAGGFLAWQRKIRYNMRNCPLYYYTKTDLETMFAQAGWKPEQYEIVDLKRDFFVRVKLG